MGGTTRSLWPNLLCWSYHKEYDVDQANEWPPPSGRFFLTSSKQFFDTQGWETRRDQRGRVYYVDHNTRTTTWQRPTTEMLAAHDQWQSGRDQAMQAVGSSMITVCNICPLVGTTIPISRTGRSTRTSAWRWRWELSIIIALCLGWECRNDPNTGRRYFVNHVNRTTQWEDPRTQGTHTFTLKLPRAGLTPCVLDENIT